MKQYLLFLKLPILAFLFFILFDFSAYSQCAGEDASVNICDITDPANQSFSLFPLLGGSPATGGIWTNDEDLDFFVGDPANGTINIWDIYYGGTYHFTYTVDDNSCTDNSATITIIVGGYAGEDNPTANACENDQFVNLFQFIGSDPNPDLGGTWSDESNTGGLSEEGNYIYDATIQGPGVYTFIYHVPAVGPCPEDTSTVVLTVNDLPNSGAPEDLPFCGVTDFSSFTNVNLFDHIEGQDPNGFWSEGATSELSGPDDTFINIQNIFDTFGYGHYGFSYTALPDHPICETVSTLVTVHLRRIVDFTGTELVVDSVCEDEVEGHDFQVLFDNLPDIEQVPDGFNFEIHYSINGPVSYNGVADITRSTPFFSIANEFVPTIGTYTLTINDILVTNDIGDIICDIVWDLQTTFEVREIPTLENAIMDIPDICEGENNTVTISNASLDDGTYTIDYELTGANTDAQTIDITFQGGSASFNLTENQLVESGTNTLTITAIRDEYCDNTADLSTSFEINLLPTPDEFDISIENVCFGDPIVVHIDNIHNINDLEIIYTISGASNAPDTIIPLIVTNNSTEFTIDASTFTGSGDHTFHLLYATNLSTGCAAQSTNTAEFTLYPIPAAPTATSPQEFCETEMATIQELTPNNNNTQWYDSLNSTTPLTQNTPLTNTTYYVAVLSNEGCISERTPVDVIINQVPAPILIQNGEAFCGVDNPTINNLTANTTFPPGFEIAWYDDNGNLLPGNTPLTEGTTYYAYTTDPATGCEATQQLEVTVSLTDCDTENPEEEYDFFIPDAFSPNGDGRNDVFRIKNIEFIFPNYEFEIYNRYGKLLFTGNINRPEWNGETKGTTLADGIAPNGIYFYVIKFNKNNTPPKQGRLYLNR